MTLSQRLNLEQSFALDASRAAEFLSDPKGNGPDADELTDYHEPSGPMTRANTMRRRSDSHTAIAPLRDRDDLLDDFVHPYVLDAREEVEAVREEIRSAALPQQKARKMTELRDAQERLKERQKEIELILERIEGGKTLDAHQLSLLLDRDISPDQREVSSLLTGESYRCETTDITGTMQGDRIGISCLWSAENARRLYLELPVHLLRQTARELEKKPRERAVGEHVEHIGVERLLDADPHFCKDRDAPGNADTRTSSWARDPRQEVRPQFAVA